MEVLKLYIHVNGCEKVESECATVQMISFDGRCDGDYFRGEILPGGVIRRFIIRISHQNYRLVI